MVVLYLGLIQSQILSGDGSLKRILLAGVSVADFIFYVGKMPTRSEKYRAKDALFSGGGNAANSAVAVKRLGGEAILAARVGTDTVGDLIIADLENEGVDTSIVYRVKDGRSSFFFHFC